MKDVADKNMFSFRMGQFAKKFALIPKVDLLNVNKDVLLDFKL